VKEQIEEETLAMKLLDKIKIAGGSNADNTALYNLDRELKDTPDSAGSALDVTAEKP
jgi:ferritin